MNGKPVEEIDGDDINLKGVENMKTNIAIMHGVTYDEVEVDTKDIASPEFAGDLIIHSDGSLMYKPNQYAHYIYVSGVRPALDIKHEELFYEFLDLIHKKDFDGALNFH